MHPNRHLVRAACALAILCSLASCASVDKPKGEVKRSPQLTEGQLQELYIARRNEGRKLLEGRQYGKALDAYLEANEIRANTPAVLLGIGRAYLGLEYPEKARRYFDKYLEVEKDNDAAVYRELALAYAGPLAALEMAVKAYAKAIAAGEGKEAGWDLLRRGEILLRLGKKDEAAADFSRALETGQRMKDVRLIQAAKDALAAAIGEKS